MTENELAKIIVNTCYQIHVSLGPGLFESVYEEVLTYELLQKGLAVSRQQGIPVVWRDIKMDLAFRADFK